MFDRALLRRRLDRAAPLLPGADFLRRRVAADLAERLEATVRDFPLAVDLGARTGEAAAALRGLGGKVGAVMEADLSPRMLAGRGGPRVALDEERSSLADGSLDLIVSALALHTVNDLPGALAQARRALKPGGLFMAAMFAGGTLVELRRALVEAETQVRGGAGPRVAPLLDFADGPRLLQRAGFRDPVADLESLTVGYAHPLALLHDLRRMGETAVMVERARPPLTRAVLQALLEAYPRRADGRIEATFEIVTLTGWAS